MHVRLASVALEHPVSDPQDRAVMPMSTLIASPLWLLEVPWDGARIGDVQIYKNDNCTQGGVPLTDSLGKELPPAWKWWNGVPCDKVKSYKLLDASKMTPRTLVTDSLPLPFAIDNVQRQEESGQAGKGRPARA